MALTFLLGAPICLRPGEGQRRWLRRRHGRRGRSGRAVPAAVVRGRPGEGAVRSTVRVVPRKVPPERAAPPEWWEAEVRLPLARELDFLLNHPVGELLITGLVIVSCLGFALQTVDLGGELANAVPRYIERGISSLFTAEYFLRWYSRNLSPKFLLTRAMIIDFCAIVPLFVDIAAKSSNSVFIRILRLTRIFRLQRMMEEEAQDMFGDMTVAQIRIANVVLTVFSILYVSAGLFFDAEVAANPEVNSFFDAFYFATITLFTVGFGDVTPLTPTGRIVTVLTVLTGAVLIPVQITEVERARKSSAEANGRARDSRNSLLSSPSFKDFVPFDFNVEVVFYA